ncbi:uncharacterized protein A4U43_C08F9500 [Asparagus officinalis]|uniref:uncharacterized protein LOC109820100 n=1 Tax=Asparagus officinalis TaxID=4686 RepID=UPI00098DF295|nr:uncharacterized protein LOC109820100 [Asparagus officinalis]ONK59703.1 uncharacterized protein A4U43_C08F9500 [Asparagus officinalis]
MERDAALRKLEKNHERKKIDGSDIIEKKMGELKVRSRGVDGEAHGVREIREIESSSSSLAKQKHEINVEMLKRKMEGISKGMMERMEEYGSFLITPSSSSNTTSSVNNSYSAATAKFGCGQATAKQRTMKEMGTVSNRCCCSCKQIVTRIAEEVKSETEQWTEMQEMLDQVRLEMEQLKSSKDLWKRRAIASELNIRSLHSRMIEWKQRARASEKKVDEPKNLVHCDEWKQARLPKIRCQQVEERSPDYAAIEKEKHVLVCRLNNPKSNFSSRSPLKEISNLLK